MKSEKLSLLSAIFVNLNIMISTGLFVNTALFSHNVGAAGFLLYPMVGILMLPLISSIATLMHEHEDGNFYTFGNVAVGSTFGFISTWSYFIAKLASCGLMLYVSSIFLQSLFPQFAHISPLILASGILILFSLLNSMDIKLGMIIQTFFLTSKIIPIIFAIAVGAFFFSPQALHVDLFFLDKIPQTIPLALYSLAGFEASCSLSKRIKNAKTNGPIAIYASFIIVLCLAALFQLFVFSQVYNKLSVITHYSDVFPYIVQKLGFSNATQHKLLQLLSFAIGTSALGGAYGILFSNAWNLYTLAEHKLIPGHNLLRRKNQFDLPAWCIGVQGFICLTYLWITQGQQIPLQQTASFGVTITYFMSVISLLIKRLEYGTRIKSITIPVLALGSCILFLTSSVDSFMKQGIHTMYMFAILFIFGLCMRGIQYIKTAPKKS